MAWRAYFLAVFAALSPAPAISADVPPLQSDEYWVVLASEQDLDRAIGDAEAIDPNAKVMHSVNGWYAAVSGPHHIANGQGRAFLDGLKKEQRAPKDAYMSKGVGFDQVVWTRTKDGVLATLSYDGEHDASLAQGNLRLELSKRATGKDEFVSVLTGFFKDRMAFREELGADNPSEKPAAQARLVQLDPGSVPDVVFTYYWQGAHCCTLTKVITLKRDNTWAAIGLGPLDGDGVALEDIDKRGFSYLVSVDQSFLYSFASYADSFAPIQIFQLKDGSLNNVTREPRFRHAILQDMFRQEYLAKKQDELRSRGYLAGWVAEKILVGEGEDAWRTMLATYQREDSGFDGFGVDKCTVNVPIAQCPDDKRVKLPFPTGLRQFLVDHGYISDTGRYAVPNDLPPPAPVTYEPPPAPQAPSLPPQLQRCAGAADTIRKLIYQQFAGRQIFEHEDYSAVTTENDATLDGYDPNIEKVTCAVSYAFPPRALIGRLAEDGNFARASSLGRLARRSGGTVTGRVRYTVKPTANGSSWIELLP